MLAINHGQGALLLRAAEDNPSLPLQLRVALKVLQALPLSSQLLLSASFPLRSCFLEGRLELGVSFTGRNWPSLFKALQSICQYCRKWI